MKFVNYLLKNVFKFRKTDKQNEEFLNHAVNLINNDE